MNEYIVNIYVRGLNLSDEARGEMGQPIFGPATGGNFYYGMQTGYSFGKHDVYVRTGKILTQDFKTPPELPVYGQFGFNFRV